jgi:hypothetical protein
MTGTNSKHFVGNNFLKHDVQISGDSTASLT